jgi:sulfatase maturation enzyme AslB (radical SAM superfamily)
MIVAGDNIIDTVAVEALPLWKRHHMLDGKQDINHMETDNGLIDPFGRMVSYLRVSVTDRCDFRCTYCMAEEMTFLPKRDLLTLEELERLCSVFIARAFASSASPAASRWCAGTSCS